MKTLSVPDAVCAECGGTFEHTVQLYDDGSVMFDIRVCPACVETRQKENEAKEALRLKANRLYLWREKQMPFDDTVIDRLPAANAPKVLAWQYRPTGLIISGMTGMGKTRTVVELLRRLWIDEGREFAFISWGRYKQQLDKAHRYGGSGVEKYVKPFYKVPVVCFDDLGHGALNENALGCLFDLIDNRVSRSLPVFITTQFDGATLGEKMAKVSPKTADALLRRLRENFQHVVFTA